MLDLGQARWLALAQASGRGDAAGAQAARAASTVTQLRPLRLEA